MGRVASYKRVKAFDPFAKKNENRGAAPKKKKRRQSTRYGRESFHGDEEFGAEGDMGTVDKKQLNDNRQLTQLLSTLKRAPNESLRDFERRVDATVASEVARVAKKNSLKNLKRKEKLRERAEAAAAAKKEAEEAEAKAKPVKKEEDYFRKETVHFNDVVQEPPRFNSFARKAKDGLPDAGKRRAADLKLAAKLPRTLAAAATKPEKPKKVKEKPTPSAREVELEQERERAIAAYRTLKKRKDLSVLREAMVAADNVEQGHA